MTLALMACSDTEAQGKKKGKEPELAICKRDKLIFEDDFSEEDLLWIPIPAGAKWYVAKKALVTKGEGSDKPWLYCKRQFASTNDVVFELRILAPSKLGMFAVQREGDSIASCLGGRIEFTQKNYSIGYYRPKEEGGWISQAVGAISYERPRWINLIFEAIGKKYAFTVEGRTIAYESDNPERQPYSGISFLVSVGKSEFGVLAIDDVKVYEALPKDEEPEKDKDKKKR